MSNAAKATAIDPMTKLADSTTSVPPDTAGEAFASAAGPSALLRVVYVGLLVLVLAAPVIGLYPVFVMKLLCFALFACAFNLLLGFTGLLSFGHAAFFGMGAYVAGWCIKSAGWSPELGIVGGAVIGAGLGLLFGLVAIRRQGIYCAIASVIMAK